MRDTLDDVLYEICHHIPFRYPLKRLYWKLQHRFNKRHQYHKPPVVLRPGYYDPDVRIMVTLLEEVANYYENSIDVQDPYISVKLKEIYDFWRHNEEKVVEEYYNLKNREKIEQYMIFIVQNLGIFWY